jgi:hypothetical protein
MRCAVEMGAKFQDVHIKFHKDWFRDSKVDRGDTYRHTQTAR